MSRSPGRSRRIAGLRTNRNGGPELGADTADADNGRAQLAQQRVVAMLGNVSAVQDRRLVRIVILLAGLLTLGIHGSPTANAAVIYKIELEPEAPRIGERVAISVSTFEADSLAPGADLVPFPLDEFPWTFVADSPSGSTVEIALTPDGRPTNRWTGNFVFSEAGRWEIGLDKSHVGTPPDPALGARLEVGVTADDADGRIPLLVGLVVVLIAIAVVVVNRTRERRLG